MGLNEEIDRLREELETERLMFKSFREHHEATHELIDQLRAELDELKDRVQSIDRGF